MTPLFTLSDKLSFDPESVSIAKLKIGTKVWNIKVLKAPVENRSELLARNAKPFMTLAGCTTGWTTVWTTESSWNKDEAVLIAPDFIGDTPEDVSMFLNAKFFGSKFWSNDATRDIVGGGVNPVVILYTIEGSDFAFFANPVRRPVKLPFETSAVLSIAMDNAESSEIPIRKFRLSSWDRFEEA